MIIVSDLHLKHSNWPDSWQPLLHAADADPHRTLVVAGDLTQWAKEWEYRVIEMFVDEVLGRGINLICCPGNHDLSKHGVTQVPFTRTSGWQRYARLVQTRLAPQACVIATRDVDLVAEVGQDVFVALRSTHRRGDWLRGDRISSDQLHWAAAQLSGLRGHRLHLLTHHSLWQLDGDKHGDLHRRKRLEKKLLRPFGFKTYINGHNHRFAAAFRSTPKKGYRIYHIQAPTLSNRTPGNAAGFVRWDPSEPGSAALVRCARR